MTTLVTVVSNKTIKSNKDIAHKIIELPKKDSDIINELVFEKMKLEYIRDVKFKRSSFCIGCTLLWVIGTGVCWIIEILASS